MYRAKDLTLGREVALKLLPDSLAADQQARQRLVQEARTASRLNHPHIATIYEVNESNAPPFLAMEFIAGETLKQTLSRGALDPSELLEIACQIAEGLQEAHSQGVVHRDIKPGNIMLDSKRRIKVLDFGLAAGIRSQRGADETEVTFLSRESMVATTGGTVPYMSPEQLRDEPPDARSDIFSFGVVLFECLTMLLPFRGRAAIDVMYAILREPPVSLRSIAPEISVAWEQLIERCLAKSPSQRFASMKDVLEALHRIEAPAEQPGKSLAVLYFENLSGAKEEEYFRDGMTEDIITDLSKIGGLSVFPRSTAYAFRDKPMPAPSVGQQLGAAYVLEGSVRRAGKRLRITTSLSETRTGRSVWAERYDRELEDVFAIQDEIAHNIARALKLVLTEKEKRAIEKIPTTEIQAYDYYLRGRQYMHQYSRKGLEYARQMFARAIAIDPNYARAHAGVADCGSLLYMYFDPCDANLNEADAASQRAIKSDPDSPEAHTARGLVLSLMKRDEEAEEEFTTAIRLNPRLYEALWFFGRSRFALGRMNEAEKLFEQAAHLSPDDYQAWVLRSMCIRAQGGIAACLQARQDALRVIEKHVGLHPDDARALYMGAQCLADLGEHARSLEWGARALSFGPDDPSILYNVADNLVLNGELEKGIVCLEKAISAGFGHKEWLEKDPDFDALRSRPAFQAILARLRARVHE